MEGGGGSGGGEDPNANAIQEFKLGQDEELRIDVEGNTVTVVMVDGMAEIFGTEMIKGKQYQFGPGTKFAIFTYHGCTIKIKGKPEMSWIAKETPMIMYLNAHGGLETMRRNAEAEIAEGNQEKRGPIVMVVGPTDVGKTTLCRILVNYAVRLGRRPIYVDLDVGQGNIAVPGTVGAMLIERPASIEDGGFIQQAPMVYFFGHKSPEANIPLYNMLASKLGQTVHERMESNRKAKASGVVINTCGWIKGEGYGVLTHIAQAFEVDVVIVLDTERLYQQMKMDMPSFVKVVWLPKSGGVVERSMNARQESRDARLREYFYGRVPQLLHPHSFQVKFSDARIFKIGAPAVPQSCMPLGMKGEETRTKLVPLTPSVTALQHRLLAVSFATDENGSNSDEVIKTNVAGYVCVTEVDMEKNRMTVLSPQPGPLPQTLLIVSDILFMDSH